MKIIVGMATMPGREKAFKKALESIRWQVDAVYVWDNSVRAIDLTDNGKFAGLMLCDEPCYYFSCDDDLIYPPDYIERMIEAIDRTGAIVSCHARILSGIDLRYYDQHTFYSCLNRVDYSGELDVCGTGVLGFRTDYFNPVHLAINSNQKMTDLLFSYYVAREGKQIFMLPHFENWIKQIDVDTKTSIHSTEKIDQRRLIHTANEIYKLKYGKDNRSTVE